MEETEKTPKQQKTPTIALLLTESQAALINAALTHYWAYIKQSGDDELQAIRPEIEVFQRNLIDEVRRPTVPAVDVDAIAWLAAMNRAKQSTATAERGSKAWQEANAMFSRAYGWL